MCLWDELRNGLSDETKLILDADKFEMAMQASEYIGEGYSKEMLGEFKISAIEQIKDSKILDLLQLI